MDLTTLDQRINVDDLRDRASRMASAQPRAYLRWAGSKRALLAHFLDVLPRRFGTYWEPFLGSGALFFLLEPHRAVLSDACGDLIETHAAVRDNVNAIIRHLQSMPVSKEDFYGIRAKRGRGWCRRAAEFIYLNKLCWNGLYRVNAEGTFNVPYGRPKTDFLADYENLRACSRALSRPGVRLDVADFERVRRECRLRDLVFFDPPYVTRHNNNGFVDYNQRLFSWADQERLAKVARALGRRGVHVLVTNANHKDVIDLYTGFKKKIITRSSTIASNSSFRGSVREVLLYRTSNTATRS